MKRYLGIIIVVGGFIFGGVILSNKFKAKTIDADRAQSIARIQHDYLERVAWIRANPDERAYKDEVGTFFRWYFKEINEHLNRFGGNKNFDGYLEELESRGAKGGVADSKLADKKAAYESTRKIFDQFRNQTYAPMWSASDRGMRLDVLPSTMSPAGGTPKIRLPVVLWGAQRELRDDGKLKKMITSAAFNVTWKLYDEKGKLYGEMPVTGGPEDKVEYPERMIPEFPAQMLLGHYEMDLLPAEVAKLEIIFTVASRSPSGGEASGTFTWKLDTPSDWKLKPGEKWEGAQDDVRSEEEIDPAKAARSQR